MVKVPTILRGEDTAARGRTLAINLPEGDYTGLTIRLQWCGLERSWESPASGASLRFDFSAADTLPIPLGTHLGRLGVVLADGTGYIISEDIRIRVTDDVAEATGEANAIYISPADAAHSMEIDLDGIEDEPATPDALRAAWKELLSRLRAAAGVALVCVGLAATARAEGRVEVQTAASGSLPWGAPVVTNVTVVGEMGLDGGTVTNIVDGLVKAATNAIPRGIDGETGTNIVQAVVTKGYVEDLGIEAGTDGEAVTNIVNGLVADATNGVVRAVEIPIYAYGGDWRLTVTDAGSTNAAAGTTRPTKDYISLLAETTGVYRRYKVEAEQEPLIIDEGATMPEVELTISDPHGCVESFEDGVISSSGVSGVVRVYGMDGEGVTRAVSITMTPIVPGKVLTEMWAEGAESERNVWNTNVFAKLSAVSTNAADMVDYRWCRHMDNWTQNAPADGHRLIPRALSRWGSDGRLNDAEWTWGGEGADKARFTPSKVNRDFFWPELLPGLQCFSARVHETTAAGNNSQCYPWLAVAPHYVITAGHYSGAWWHGMRNVVQPYFCTDLENERFMTASTDRMVGKVPQGDGVVADIMLVHVTAAIPSNCIARFATDETLERLSLSKFGKCAALTITSHQTVAPLCLNTTQSGNIFSWSGEPGASSLTVPYMANSGADGKAVALEHPTHMFDSGTPVFLATPSGKVIPLTHYCMSNGRTALGPRFGDVLTSLSSMVRTDSGGTEDIRFWTFEDLATGAGTNSFEEVSQ